jgi:hypothetical protein
MGRIKFEDVTAQPGTRYAYRLKWTDANTVRTTQETWVNVPRLRFALVGAAPNPTSQRLAIAFSLPDEAPARLELVDIAGRRLLWRDVGNLGPGDHVLDLGSQSALPAGIYLIRLERSGESLVTRACVLR